MKCGLGVSNFFECTCGILRDFCKGFMQRSLFFGRCNIAGRNLFLTSVDYLVIHRLDPWVLNCSLKAPIFCYRLIFL